MPHAPSTVHRSPSTVLGKLIMLWLPLLTLSNGKCAAFLTIFSRLWWSLVTNAIKTESEKLLLTRVRQYPGKDTVASLINDRRLPGMEREDLHPSTSTNWVVKHLQRVILNQKRRKKIIICRPGINQGLGERGWEGAWPTATVINVYEQPLSQVGWIPMA